MNITNVISKIPNQPFVKVLIWQCKEEFDKNTGLETKTWHSKETYINLALVFQLSDTTIEDTKTQFKRIPCPDSVVFCKPGVRFRPDNPLDVYCHKSGWCARVEDKQVVKEYKVLEMNLLHKNINVNVGFISLL